MNSNPKSRQEGGSHYKSFTIQPGDYIRQNDLGWYEGNVIKYVTRHRLKNGLEDVNKAIHYLEMIKEEYLRFIDQSDPQCLKRSDKWAGELKEILKEEYDT